MEIQRNCQCGKQHIFHSEVIVKEGAILELPRLLKRYNDKKVFLIAAEKVGTPPERCLVFEDVISAAETAKSAGMIVCAVYDERSEVHRDALKEVCDYYINGFEELL